MVYGIHNSHSQLYSTIQCNWKHSTQLTTNHFQHEAPWKFLLPLHNQIMEPITTRI